MSNKNNIKNDSPNYDISSDFNKAAGLPEDFKIHKSTLDELYRFNTSFKENTANYLGISNYYTNIDMADTIRQYYSKFDQIINHSFENSNKTSFSIEDLNSLPKGYSVYNTDFKFMFQNLDSDIAKDTFNPDMSVYPKNEDGSYPKEALFMSFLKSSGGEALEGGNTTLNPLAKAHIEAMAKESFDGSLASLNDIMTGKVDFAQILKAHAQDGWLDSKIYAKENNIAWQNSSIGYGGAWFDNQFNQAKASGYSPSNESINSYVNSVMDKLNNILNQTRV
ncbi:hypothetical protein UPTC5055_000822 [Campylobacter lari]